MGFDEKVVRIRAAGSGLGYCDLVASIKKLAVPKVFDEKTMVKIGMISRREPFKKFDEE